MVEGAVGGGGAGGFRAPVASSTPRTVTSFTLAEYPELAAALKLDDTQKKLVEGPSGPSGFRGSDDVYLTPEQTTTAVALLGDAPKGTMRATSDRRMNRGFGGVAGPGGGFGGPAGRIPAPIGYLFAPDVQADLKMTEEQIKTLADLRAKFPNRSPLDREVSPAKQKEESDKLVADMKAAVDKLLTDTQKQRFEQILRHRFVVSEFTEDSELAKVMEVTAEQRKAYTAAGEAQAAAIIKAVGSGKPLDEVKAAVVAADKAYVETVSKILTADQQAKKKDWLGEPFTGRFTIPGGPGGPGGPSPIVAMRKLTFGKYYTELTILSRYPGAQKELKMTEEQIKKATEALAAMNEKFPAAPIREAIEESEKAAKLLDARSEAIEKAIGEILTKEQLARFRELLIQQAEFRTGPGGPGGPGGFGGLVGTPNTAAGVPGVAATIKLTDDQKKKLLSGTAAAEVLTDEQKTAIKEMAGKAVNVAEVFARPGFPGGPLPPLPRAVTLAQNTYYWDIAKITPDQIGKLAAAYNEYSLVSTTAETPAKRTDAAGLVAKAVEAILSAEQLSRLEQLALQSSAANSMVSALLGTARNPSAAKKELAITDEQEKAIRAATAEFGELSGLLNQVDFTTDGERKDAAELRMKLRDKLDAKIEDLLTADQKAKWKKLLGEPHTGFTKQPLRGGFGGAGGGGLGGGGFGGPGGFEP